MEGKCICIHWTLAKLAENDGIAVEDIQKETGLKSKKKQWFKARVLKRSFGSTYQIEYRDGQIAGPIPSCVGTYIYTHSLHSVFDTHLCSLRSVWDGRRNPCVGTGSQHRGVVQDLPVNWLSTKMSPKHTRRKCVYNNGVMHS